MSIIGGGAQFQKKRFTTMGEGMDIRPSVMSDTDRKKMAADDKAIITAVAETPKKRKYLIPYGNRILVRKKKVGNNLGSGILVAPDSVRDNDTDLAIVVYVPDQSFVDLELVAGSEDVVKALSAKAKEGSADALNALITFNQYLLVKAIKPGDEVLVSKYAGVSFHDNKSPQDLTLVDGESIIGIVREEV